MEKFIFVLILFFCSLFKINGYDYVKCGLIDDLDDEQVCTNLLKGTVTQGSFYSCSYFEDKPVKDPYPFDKACCNMKCMQGKGELVLRQYSGKCCFDVYEPKEEFLFISMYFDQFNSDFNEAIGIIDDNFNYNKKSGTFNGNKILCSDWNMCDYSCKFNSKEDLLNGLAYLMEGKFIYSYGGGHSRRGPTKGTIENSNDKIIDDSNIIGFDCSGLVMFLLYNSGSYLCDLDMSKTNSRGLYNFAKNKKLLKNSNDSIVNGNVLFYGNDENSIHHVTIALENGKMIEAYGHDSNGNGLPIQIVNIRTQGLFAIGDFLGKTYECNSNNFQEIENEDESYILYIKFSLIIILVILFL